MWVFLGHDFVDLPLVARQPPSDNAQESAAKNIAPVLCNDELNLSWLQACIDRANMRVMLKVNYLKDLMLDYNTECPSIYSVK